MPQFTVENKKKAINFPLKLLLNRNFIVLNKEKIGGDYSSQFNN